jgi:hypothetical protein
MSSPPPIFGNVKSLLDMVYSAVLWDLRPDSLFAPTGSENGAELFPIFLQSIFPWAGHVNTQAMLLQKFGTRQIDYRAYYPGVYGDFITAGQRINPVMQLDEGAGDVAAVTDLTGMSLSQEIGVFKTKNVTFTASANNLAYPLFVVTMDYPNQSIFGTNQGAGENIIVRPLLGFLTTANGGQKINGALRIKYSVDGNFDNNQFYDAQSGATRNNIYTGTSGSSNTVGYFADVDTQTTDLTQIVAVPNPITSRGATMYYQLVPGATPGAVMYPNLLATLFQRQGKPGIIWWINGADGRRLNDNLLSITASNWALSRAAMANGNHSRLAILNYTNDLVTNAVDVKHPNPPVTTKAAYKAKTNDIIDAAKAAGYDHPVDLFSPVSTPGAQAAAVTAFDIRDAYYEIAQSRPADVVSWDMTTDFPGGASTATTFGIAPEGGNYGHIVNDGSHLGGPGQIAFAARLAALARQGLIQAVAGAGFRWRRL